MDYDLAGTGSMVVDAIYSTPRIIGPEEKALLQPYEDGTVVRRLVGGVTLNHLGWARLFGLRVAIFGKQADDPEGRFLRTGMDRLGIAQHLDLSGAASSVAQLFVDPDGERAIYMARGATGDLTPEEIDRVHAPVIESTPIVSTEISQLPLATVRRVLERARAAGARTVLDLDLPLADAVPALGTREELDACLELADVIKPSLAAVGGIVDETRADAVAEALAQRYGAEAVAVTDGAAGCVIFADGSLLRVPAVPVEVKDTTGAGDAFLGGLLAGMHHGLDWAAAAKLGNACGAACCERIGAFPDNPSGCRSRALELYGLLEGPALPEAAGAVAAASSGGDALEDFLGTASEELNRLCTEVDTDQLRQVAAMVREAEAAGGRVHLTGIGKPAHVARYGAALLSSTGTAATYLHGTEAIHGSVGQLRPGDLVIAISNSGSTAELLACVAGVVGMGAQVVAVTGDPDSPLARLADTVLTCRIGREGGPLGLAPRTSVLAQTLVLAALSVQLQAERDLDPTEYHRRHPAGALGGQSAPATSD